MSYKLSQDTITNLRKEGKISALMKNEQNEALCKEKKGRVANEDMKELI